MPSPRQLAAMSACVLVIAGCARAKASHGGAVSRAASVSAVAGTNRVQVHVTSEAVKRLDIQVGTVRDAAVAPRRAAAGDGGAAPVASPVPRRVIPFAAVMYTPAGDAFTYVVAGPGLYERAPLAVEYVAGDLAVLISGPTAGTPVVTVGGPELLGIEFGTGE